MKNKNWFVKLQQYEIESCKTTSQVAVFASIKSYSSNGNAETVLSFGDIAKRAKCTRQYVKKVVTQLTPHLVEIVGKATVFGGKANIYKVVTQLTPDVRVVDTLQKKVVRVVDGGVNIVDEGVNCVGTNLDNLKLKTKGNKKKVLKNIYLTQHEIWEIALKNNCDISEVLNTYWGVIDPDNRQKYQIKNTKQTLNNWVRRAISKKTIQATNDFASLEILKFNEPKPNKANLLVKPK